MYGWKLTPNIILNRLKFTKPVTFVLLGTAEFNNCKFEGNVNIHSKQHQHEPGTAYTQRTNPVIYARQHQISLFGCIFENTLSIEFESNVRMLLVKRSHFRSSIWIKNIRHFDQMKGHYIPTPSYLVVQVKNSEISKPSIDNRHFCRIES